MQRVTEADLRRAAEHARRGVDADVRRATDPRRAADFEVRPGAGVEGRRASAPGVGGRGGPLADARPATVPVEGRRGAVPADEAVAAGHETVGEVDGTGVAEVRPVVLRPGDRGPEVTRLQRRLHASHYYFGRINGRYDEQTKFAVWALQKTHGMAVKGVVGPREFAALDRPVRRRPLVPNGGANRVEVNLTRQMLTVYRNRRAVLYSHISSGAEIKYCHNGHCGNAVTPVGDFRVTQRAPGWTTGPLGSMFNSLYFVGGIALHGSSKVPLRPASHGCVRLPLSTSKRLYEIVNIGDPVYVRGKIHRRR